MASLYEKWTIGKLKVELVARGAVTRGRKHILIERLEAYDHNQNFKGEVITDIVPKIIIPDWPACVFKQLVSDHRIFLPKLSVDQIKVYLQHRAACDSLAVKDLKALEKGIRLVYSNRVEAYSLHISTTGIYITGTIHAEMKKVSYSFRLRLDRHTSEVLNSDCECPAGKGPHSSCKHVAASLYVMHKFTSDASEMLVAKSCTEKPQRFHMPQRLHSGSPIKAESFNDIWRVNMEDPRPTKYRKMEGYQDSVRNQVFNYCSNTSHDISMRFLYQDANLGVAVHDHAYTKLPFTQHWVDSSVMVSEDDANKIELMTRQQGNSLLWHSERTWRLTASRFGEICAISSRRNIFKFFESLIDPVALTTPAVLHGKQYESKAIKQFSSKYNTQVRSCGLHIYLTEPYLAATPDGIIDDLTLVEVKCPYAGRNEKINAGNKFPFLKFENGKLCLKQSHKYYDQIQGQMLICSRIKCYFIVYTFQDIFVELIEIDNEYCNFCLVPKLKSFYIKHFRPHIAKSIEK